MKDSDPRPAPPIPPRRLKRKNKPIVRETDVVAEAATTSVIRLEQRPRLPPPPPPQRGLPRRVIHPQVLPPPEVKDGNIFAASYSAKNCLSGSIIGNKMTADGIKEVQPTLSTFGTTLPLARGNDKKPPGEEPTRRKREKGKTPRPNDYPPLFFTLQDFQDVMSDVENPYSRTLKNMSTFEPTPKPRGLKFSNNDLPDTTENGNVLFKVTTTNLPFEKSLSELNDVGNDPSHFIFEDYVDRRQKPAQRQSKQSNTKLVLFGDDTFDREDEDRTISTNHTASRVRFLVDSPTKNESCDKIAELDSLQNIDSLPLDLSPSQDLIPDVNEVKPRQDEDEDEFGDVPFDSLLNDPTSSLCVDPSEDSTSSKTDFQTILVHATVEPVPLVEGVEKPLKKGAEIHSNIEFDGEKDGSFSEEKVVPRAEDVCEESKDPCFKEQDSESDVKCLEMEKSAFIELYDDQVERVEAVTPIVEKRKIMVDESLRDLMEVETNGDKSPSENIRRNSFLMNMLQHGNGEPDEGKLCKVVATHPKTPIHGSCKIDGGRKRGESSAAVEAKSKLLGELSSSFSAIKLKPVNNFEEVQEEKQSASDLKVDSINVGKEKREDIEGVKNQDDKDNIHDDDDDDDDDDDEDGNEAENNIKYELNRNLDSVLDINNVVECKVINEEPIQEELSGDIISRKEPQDRSSVCSQKTDEIIIDKKNNVANIDSVCEESNKNIEFFEENESKKKKIKTKTKKKKKKKDVEDESDNNNDADDNDGNCNHGMINIKINNNNNNKNNKILEVGSKSSVDKCAIVQQCNNNNDNNAMTPVDISYDQSQNDVSIIPGSVRSFVKFYEIQGETSVGLNSNDTAAVPKIKVEATESTSDNFHEIKSKNTISYPTVSAAVMQEIENDIKYTIVTRKPVILQKQRNEVVPGDQKQIVNQRLDTSDKSTEPAISSKMFCETDGKRKAQLPTGSTLIRSKSNNQNKQEKTDIERRRELRPRLSGSKKVDAVTPSRNNTVSEIAPGIQDGPTAGVIKDVVRSGTSNHLVPKSSPSTINEHYTFYCTV